MLGQFRMVGEDGIITVQYKSDPFPVFIAELMHECYHVLPLAPHEKIYTAATDSCYQGFTHLFTHFCSTATDIYAPSCILHRRQSRFFCPSWAKYNSKDCIPLPVSNSQF